MSGPADDNAKANIRLPHRLYDHLDTQTEGANYATGDMIYRDTGVWKRLAIGAEGRFLVVASTGLPAWVGTNLNFTTAAGLIINETGTTTVDVRIETDTEENAFFSDASADYVYIGGTTNGVRIAKGGELVLIGSATRWEDLRVEPTARGTGANNPTFEQYADDSGLGDTGTSRGIFLYSFDDANAGSEKEVFFTMQMPHAWIGTSIGFHVHWIGAAADTSSAPRWGLEYAWKDIGQTFAGTTTVYTDGSNYTDVGTDANITAGKHYISKFSALAPGTGADGISSILVGRLFRDSANAGDTYNAAGAKCGLLYIDAHYEIDAFGSSTEYSK